MRRWTLHWIQPEQVRGDERSVVLDEQTDMHESPEGPWHS
jgi:hypothetical protein